MNVLVGKVRQSLYLLRYVRANSKVVNPDDIASYNPVKSVNSITAASSPIILNENDLLEEFVRGSGPGGQSINKSMNRVRLTHTPTGMTVTCQDQRDLTSNRKIARTTLQNKLNYHYNGDDSKIGRRILRLKRRKQKAHSRAKAKYKTDDNVDNE